ncbi:MAG TPA: PaaI family thioesterase [Spirochaetota bacterium]|nr:PaaI family thioesterase [Spirochaetota bacterium]HQO03083.1 PaaI family thioesterase [Spirochaetota bacterium]
MECINSEKYRKLRNRDNHNCFGCSPKNSVGLRMEFFSDDKEVVSHVTVPAHMCGWDTMVHGGIISTIMDEIMSWTTIYLMKSFILTKSMNVDFLKPVYIETPLKVIGNVVEKINDREALTRGELYNDQGVLCARSTGTFALLSPEYVKKKGMIKEEDFSEYMNMFL